MSTPQQMLQQLLPAVTLDQIRANLLSTLQSYPTNPLPTTDWQVGAVERSIVELDAIALQTFVTNLIPVIASGGFVDLANALWLPLLALEMYLLTQNAATYTQGNITLTCSASAGPYTITPGTLWFIAASGNRYQNLTGGTLPTGGTLVISVQSESVNHSVASSPNDIAPLVNYVDAVGTITTLGTQLAGVTCNNPAPTFGTTILSGSSSGTVTPSGTPTGPHTIIARIDTAGQTGLASWSYSLDGSAFVSAGPVSSFAVPGSGITLTLANGGGVPSFNAGDTFTVVAPGTWITQQGTDLESATALASRCKNRWPSLAALYQAQPTLGFYDLMARQASTQVTQTKVITDGNINNKVNICIAGQAGVLPAGVVSAVQAYINARVGQTDYPVVSSPNVRAITLGGATVKATASTMAAAQAQLQASLQTYFNTVGINGLIKHGFIIDLIENTPGIVDVTDTLLTINGVAASLQLPISPGMLEIAQWTQQIASALTWQAV